MMEYIFEWWFTLVSLFQYFFGLFFDWALHIGFASPYSRVSSREPTLRMEAISDNSLRLELTYPETIPYRANWILLEYTFLEYA
jgi:hypothetical protein